MKDKSFESLTREFFSTDSEKEKKYCDLDMSRT